MHSKMHIKGDMGEGFRALIVNDDKKSVLLLGYRIELTETEYRILASMAEANGANVSRSRLSQMVSASEESLAVHIVNINKKAYPITGRKLICSRRNQGYFLTETT